MKFSLITIVLNDVKNIEKTILSVIGQHNIDLEYIVIDGGSIDGTVDVIRNHEKSLAYWKSEPDGGVSEAFNKGLSCATGDIIGLVNSGDFLEPSILTQVSEAFTNNHTDIVYGNVQYWKDQAREYVYKANHELLPKFMSINHPSTFVRKEVYKKHGYFDTKYKLAIDYELMLRFYLNGVKFFYFDKTLANMVLGGLSDVYWQKAYYEVFLIQKKYFGGSNQLYLYYLSQVFKHYVSNALDRFKCGKIKEWYRKFLSPVKKTK
jgi:glycosyltransferase involved in cell wall biosynthesis